MSADQIVSVDSSQFMTEQEPFSWRVISRNVNKKNTEKLLGNYLVADFYTLTTQACGRKQQKTLRKEYKFLQ